MRITMLCSSHVVWDERVMYKQAVSLARMGHEVTVFGRGAMDAPAPDVRGLSLQPLMPGAGSLWARLRMLPRLYRAALRSKPDVITCHEPESAWVGLLARRRCGARVLFDVHECFQDTLTERVPRVFRPLTRAAALLLLRRLGRRCDWLTVVSPPNHAFYSSLRSDGRVDIVHNSPRMELFPPCHHAAQGPVTLCHDGFLDHSRGMLQILDALALARKTADVRLLIVGKIEPTCQAAFDRKLAELVLAEHVEIPGWKPYEEIGRLESTAQIGLVTLQPGGNTFKSLNNKLYNYMSCAQPVVAPAGSATETVVRQYDCGLIVDATKPQEIANAVLQLVRDVDLRVRLGWNGRRAIEEHLGWHRMEALLDRIYSQLARHPQ